MSKHEHLGFKARLLRAREDYGDRHNDAWYNAKLAGAGAIAVFVISAFAGGLSWESAGWACLWAIVGAVAAAVIVPAVEFLGHLRQAPQRIRDDWVWSLEQRLEVLELKPEPQPVVQVPTPQVEKPDPDDEFKFWRIPIPYADMNWYSSRFHKPLPHCPDDDAALCFRPQGIRRALVEPEYGHRIAKNATEHGHLECPVCGKEWAFPEPTTFGNAQKVADAVGQGVLRKAREEHESKLAAKRAAKEAYAPTNS